MKNGEHYFAFISYSRKDYEIARAIWRRLESFRYPARVEKQYRPKGSKYVREIFFDRTKLDCSNEDFKKGIYGALAQSRYLVVICSPDSAVPNENGKHWVNEEISYFLSQHGGDASLVVPVLLNGGVTNLPPAINTESMRSRNNPICLKKEDNTDGVVAQILSYLFHLPITLLLSKLNSQRLRFFRRIAMIAVGLALVFSVMAVEMFVLKTRAETNRCLADENAHEAKRQTEIATTNAREAERQAEVARRNAEVAEHERELAIQSLDFMVDTFKMSDPLNAGQSDFRMVDALKARVSDIAKLEPWELRADVGCQVGSLLHNVGLFDDATNLLFKSVSLNLDKRPNSPEAAYSLYCASWCFMDMLDIPTGLMYAQKALSIYENAGKRDQLRIALVCNAIGVFSMNMGRDFEQARKYLNRALEIRQCELGDKHLDVATVYCNLGYLYAKEQNFRLSIKAHERALEIYRQNDKDSHVGAAKAWRGIGLVSFNLKEYEKAMDAFDKALVIQTKAVGRNSRSVSNLYRDIGFTYRNMGDYPKALASMKTALEIAREIADKTGADDVIKAAKNLEGYVHSIKCQMRYEKNIELMTN